MTKISSSQNPRYKKALRLHQSRSRKQQNRIIIFGDAEIRRAVDSKVEIVEIYYCSEAGDPGELLDLVGPPVEHFELSESLFQKLTFGGRNEGIVAIAKRPKTELGIWQPEQSELVLVLESIEKPGNIGAVFRSACAAGVDTVLLSDPVSDVFHPNAIRSSLGTVFAIPVYCGIGVNCKTTLVDTGFQIVVTRVDASREYTDCDLAQKTAIVLGNEANGLSDVWSGSQCTSVMIPMQENVDSLNIAMASTLMVFEARRQRNTLN